MHTSQEDNREKNRELWQEWVRFGEATGVATHMVVTHPGWNDPQYAPNHYWDQWQAQENPSALVFIQPGWTVADHNWQRVDCFFY